MQSPRNHLRVLVKRIVTFGLLSVVFFDSSVAEAINTSGVVVGQADVLNSNGTTEFHAFIYSGGKLQDLNNLIPSGSGWVLTEATGINDKRQIVCDAYNATTSSTHAFLLNPN